MLPLNAVHPNITLLVILLISLLALAWGIILFKEPATASSAWVATVLVSGLGAIAVVVTLFLVTSVQPNNAIVSWADERYGIVLDSDDASELADEKFIKLSDGTAVIMDTPNEEAEGYLLYAVNKDELPVKSGR